MLWRWLSGIWFGRGGDIRWKDSDLCLKETSRKVAKFSNYWKNLIELRAKQIVWTKINFPEFTFPTETPDIFHVSFSSASRLNSRRKRRIRKQINLSPFQCAPKVMESAGIFVMGKINIRRQMWQMPTTWSSRGGCGRTQRKVFPRRSYGLNQRMITQTSRREWAAGRSHRNASSTSIMGLISLHHVP